MNQVRLAAFGVWIAALVCCATVNAQAPEIDINDIEVEGPCFFVQFATSMPGLGSVAATYYGKDPNPTDEFRTRKQPATQVNQTLRTDRSCDLAPNTKYYIQPFSTDLQQVEEGLGVCAEVCTNCDFGDGPTSASCDAIGEPPHVTTGFFSAVQSPTAPVHAFDPTTVPEITGSVFPVAVDGQNRCVDFEAQVSAAAAANSDLWHSVEIPAGAICELIDFDLPIRSGPGFGNGGIVITTGGDSRLFPPQGVRADPTYQNVFATLRPATVDEHAYDWIGQHFGTRWFEAAAGADGYRLQNIRLATPDHTEMPVRQFDVVGVSLNSDDVTLFLDRPHNLEQNDLIVLNMNPECVGLQGVRRLSAPSGNQILITNQNISGECTSGTVTQAISTPLTSCTATTPVRCDTAVPHGLPVYETLPILSIGGASNRDLTVNTMHRISGASRYIDSRQVIRITGSPGGVWDGLRVVQTTSPTLIRLKETFAVPCSSNCGFYQRVDVIQMAETGSADVDGSRHFSVVDDNTFELYNTSASQATTGGFSSFHPDLIFSFLPLAFAEAERLVLDRVLVDCGGFPYRTSVCIDAGSDRIAIVNSFLREGNFWSPVDPLSNYWQSLWQGIQFLYFGFGVIMTNANDLQVLNNTFWQFRGIVWFADSTPEPPESDTSFVRNLMYSTEALTAGRPDSNGRYYAHRHCWEQKAVNRTRIEGNYFSGNPVDHHPGGHCLVSSPRAAPPSPDRSVRDLTIHSNVIERTGSFLALNGDSGPDKNVPPSRRIDISNNLIRDIDYFLYRSTPSGTSGANLADGFGGYMLATANATADLSIRHNTLMPNRGRHPSVIRFATFSHSLLEVEQNIFSVGDDEALDELEGGLFPSCSGLNGPALYDCFVRREAQRDPLSTFDDNVLVGCLDNPTIMNTENYLINLTDTSFPVSVHRAEVESHFVGIELTTPNIYAGRIENDDSCNDRIEQVLEDGGYAPEPAFAGHGTDVEELLDDLGQMRAVTVSRPTSNTLRFAYQAPDAEACWVDVSDDSAFTVATSVERVSDGGGATQRSVDVPNIGAGEYWYRILCSAHQARGKVQLGS